MTYQFIHCQTHARARSKKASSDAARPVQEIVDEVLREPHANPHIVAPKPPLIVAGSRQAVEQLADRIEDMAAGIKAETGRAPRKDSRALMSVIASHPAYCDQLTDEATRADYEAWQTRTVEYFQAWAEARGAELVAAVEHTDESHPHLHIYLLPCDLRADRLHPGKAAKAAYGADQKAGNRAYREAMRAWQDEYHAAVAVDFGMARLGPKNRRLSRADWLAEKAALQEEAQRRRELDAQAAQVEARNAALDRREKDLAGREIRLSMAESIIEKTRQRAENMLAEAEKKLAEAEKIIAWAREKYEAVAARFDALFSRQSGGPAQRPHEPEPPSPGM